MHSANLFADRVELLVMLRVAATICAGKQLPQMHHFVRNSLQQRVRVADVVHRASDFVAVAGAVLVGGEAGWVLVDGKNDRVGVGQAPPGHWRQGAQELIRSREVLGAQWKQSNLQNEKSPRAGALD